MSRRVWLQNEYMTRVSYWAERGELEAHIFRKGYQRRWYEVERVEIGDPQPTATYTILDLLSRGIVGIYSYRQSEDEGAWPLLPP